MSELEAKRFIAATKSDAGLLGRIEAIGTDAKAVFALVQSEGFDCTAEEIRAAFLEEHGATLTSEQLEAVAGGLSDTEEAVVVSVGAIAGSVLVVGGAIAAGAAAGAI